VGEKVDFSRWWAEGVYPGDASSGGISFNQLETSR